MVEIPESNFLVAVALMERDQATQEDHRRPHLGASEVGDECLRKIWYSFRWVSKGERDARSLRILRRGKAEEQQMLHDLRDLGYQVAAGEEHRVTWANGHFGGTPDGLIRGIPAAPETWHVLELKTSNDSNWKKLAKAGVEQAQPTHYVQMQVYMLGTGLDRALYLSVNKNDDTIYEERVPLNRVAAQRFVDRGIRAIKRETLPERISEDPDWYQCRMCRHHDACFEPQFPDRTCRTCLHVTPEADLSEQEAGWWCSKHNKHLTLDEQRAGCGHHRYLPELLHWMKQLDATEADVLYDVWIDQGPS